MLRIDQIKLDGGTQPRTAIDQNTVRDYAEALQNGATFPPVTVFYDGDNYWLADGFHRLNAHKYLEWLEIDADVRQGTLKDAQWHSLSANQTHGLRRSRADVERAIKFALLHPEVIPTGENSNSGIAKHIGTSHPTVAKYRNELIASGILKDFQDTPRIVERNGTTYTQNTANIGKRPEQVRTEYEWPMPAPHVDAAPLAFVEPATRIAPAAEFPPHDPETGEVIEPAPTYPPEFLEAAHRPMSPMPYQLPALEQVQTDATIEELRRVLGKLLSFRGRVEPEVLYGDLVGVGVMEMAGHAYRMLGDWLTPADTRDVFTVDAQVVTL